MKRKINVSLSEHWIPVIVKRITELLDMQAAEYQELVRQVERKECSMLDLMAVTAINRVLSDNVGRVNDNSRKSNTIVFDRDM